MIKPNHTVCSSFNTLLVPYKLWDKERTLDTRWKKREHWTLWEQLNIYREGYSRTFWTSQITELPYKTRKQSITIQNNYTVQESHPFHQYLLICNGYFIQFWYGCDFVGQCIFHLREVIGENKWMKDQTMNSVGNSNFSIKNERNIKDKTKWGSFKQRIL